MDTNLRAGSAYGARTRLSALRALIYFYKYLISRYFCVQLFYVAPFVAQSILQEKAGRTGSRVRPDPERAYVTSLAPVPTTLFAVANQGLAADGQSRMIALTLLSLTISQLT